MEPSKLEYRSRTARTNHAAVPQWFSRKVSVLAVALLVAALPGCGAGSPDELEPVDVDEQELRLLSAPTLVAPANDATLQDPQPLFSWQLKECHDRVLVQLCADPSCKRVKQSFIAHTCTGTQPKEVLAQGTHYWRVARVYGPRIIFAWSAIRRFVIGPPPPPITQDLFGVWSVSASDVWVVGAAGTILHYNGTWSTEASPTTQDLRSVWATSGGQAWAVGATGTILRRNGTSWVTSASPTAENLWGVWASGINDAWAVGGAGLILHWNGISWTISHDRMAGAFRAVWGTGTSDVWVVGSGREPDGDYASLLLHWNGASWSESYVCNPEGTRFASGGWVASLTDVWGVSGGTVWSAGQCNSGASFIPYGYVAQNDGGGAGWGDTTGFGFGQPLGKYRPLYTIWSSGAGDVWAASGNETAIGGGTTPNMLHYNGTSWTESTQAITVGISDLGGTAASDVWAVGRAGKRLHYDGTTWTAAP